MSMLRLLRRIVIAVVVAGFGGFLTVVVANWWVLRSDERAYSGSPAGVPENDIAIVLGTSPRLRGGWKNPFFEGRMDAAAALFKAGKVRHLLVTGDNRRKDYDEPTAMRDALVERGVPMTAITLDYAGFRTLDSIERARAVFGLTKATIVTDDFHIARSLFLAKAKGLNAVGYSGEPVPWKWSKKTRTREIASRVKACLDVYVLGTKPKFYGPREHIPLTSATARL